MLRRFKLFLPAAAIVLALGAAAPAVFADDGTTPDSNTVNPPPMSPAQMALQDMLMPLRNLVSLSDPSALVTVQAVPARLPTSVVVSIADPTDGSARDATLDSSFIASLVSQAPSGDHMQASADATAVMQAESTALQDSQTGDNMLPAGY